MNKLFRVILVEDRIGYFDIQAENVIEAKAIASESLDRHSLKSDDVDWVPFETRVWKAYSVGAIKKATGKSALAARI